jgi:hypothetical protein
MNKWENIKTGISNIWDNITNSVKGAAGNVYDSIKNGLDNAWDYITSIPSRAYQWGLDIINALIDGIQSLHIPTPHFDFSVGYRSVAGVDLPVPHVDVDWYKAGGIFNSPQIVGVGDVPEVVMPLEKMPGLMAQALRMSNERQGSTSSTNNVQNVTHNYSFNVQGMTVRDESDIRKISEALYNRAQSAARAAGY